MRRLSRSLLRWLGHQDWLPFGARDRIIRLACNPDTVGRQVFTVDFYGLTYHGELSRFIDWTVYFYGAYELPILMYLRDIASRMCDPVFVDVGANVGLHTLFMARWVSRVHAFEPWAPVADVLGRRLQDNNLTNVTLHRVGLSDRPGILPYAEPRGANTSTGSFLSDGSPGTGTCYLPVVKGDEYFPRHVGRVDLIKIDVEGFEYRVLAGLREVLGAARPIILMEVTKATLAQIREGGLERIVGHDWAFSRVSEKGRRCQLTPLRSDEDIFHAVLCPSEKTNLVSINGGRRGGRQG